MALWDDSTLTGNDAALLFNQQAAGRSALLGAQNNPFVAWAMGQKAPGDNGIKRSLSGGNPFMKVLDGGKNIEVKFRQQIADRTGVGYGAGERAASAPNPQTNPRANGVIPVANFIEDEFRDKSDWDAYKGKAYKDQVAYLTQENDAILESFFSTAEAQMAAGPTAAASTTVLGSLLWNLIGDTWATFDRTDAANVDLKAQTDAVAAITMAKLHGARRWVRRKRGTGVVCFCASNVYGFLQGKIESAAGYMATQIKDETLEYSKEYFRYGGMDFVEVYDMPNGYAAVVDPHEINTWFQDGKVATTFMPWIIDPAHKAQMLSKYQMRGQLIVTNPNKAYVFTGITS